MCLRQKNTQGEFIVVERYRTVLKKFYITKSQNQTLNYLISYTGLRNFSNYARTMLFKKFPIVLVFDETLFEDLIFSLRRIKNNINQLAKLANSQKEVTPQLWEEAYQQLRQLEELIKENLSRPDLLVKS